MYITSQPCHGRYPSKCLLRARQLRTVDSSFSSSSSSWSYPPLSVCVCLCVCVCVSVCLCLCVCVWVCGCYVCPPTHPQVDETAHQQRQGVPPTDDEAKYTWDHAPAGKVLAIFTHDVRLFVCLNVCVCVCVFLVVGFQASSRPPVLSSIVT